MKKKQLSMNIASIVGATALTIGIPAHVYAQSSGEEVQLENVYVTGSLIKRSEETNSLPIQIITSLDIAKTGVSTAAELIAKLPSMQGFTTAGDSVGGSGGGLQTANLRGIGSQYTLVLLNGRRMAPSTSGSTVDLSNIPISAIESVEVLTDGASALYGSDAIAGVVNFILKKNVQSTTISGRVDRPQESGGASRSFDLTTGFGDFDTDGFNIMLSLSHEKQNSLAASERDFAETGIITFTHPDFDQEALFFNGSGNAVPGNARVIYTADDAELNDGVLETTTLVFNPYQQANGSCPTQTSPIGMECFFDFTSTIQILPENERNSLFLQGDFKINDNMKAFTSLLYSENEVVSRIAPYPTGYVPFFDADDDDTISDFALEEVVTFLPDLGLSQTEIDSITDVDGRWRALAAGNRTTELVNTSLHFVAGLEGTSGLIDYNISLTHAETNIEENYPTGWLLLDEFVDATSAGEINIFAGQDEFDDQAALANTIYSGDWEETDITMTLLAGQAAMPLFEMAGGSAQIATGFDYRSTTYEKTISEANANEEILFLSAGSPSDLERSQYGAFAEALFPISSTIELNASLRYDSIGAVSDNLNGGSDINDTESDITYKVNGVWDITNNLKLRASYGTGFKAPSLLEIGEPRVDFGVTSGTFACPLSSDDPLFDTCFPGEAQYNIFREGTAELKPEESTQYTVGFVFTPTDSSSIIIDYWNIELTNLVERLTEAQIFADPVFYRDLFTTKTNLATGDEELAIIQAAQNAGTSKNSGIDYSFNNSFDLEFGDLTTTFGGTYMIESESSLTGSSLGKFGEDDNVVFRNIINASASLSHGNFTETLSVNYRSGYTDQAQVVTLLEDDGSFGDDVDVQLDVPSYTTLDLVISYSMLSDSLLTTFGINNLTDKEPPLSLRTSGAGHQVGWDPRYADAFGRTFYLSASYEF